MLPLMERLISRFAVRMPSAADLTKIYQESFVRQMFGAAQIDGDSITNKPSGGDLPAFAQIL